MRVLLLPGVTKAKKPKPLCLIEFSLGEFVIGVIASPLKFVQSFLFAFYAASASSHLYLLQNSKFIFCRCLSATVSGLVCCVNSVI